MKTQDSGKGSSFDDFLREEEIYEEASSMALARVLSWQVTQLMKKQGLSKTTMAQRMGTSRAQLDRLRSPSTAGVTLDTMHRAARALDRELYLELR